MQVVWFKRDLRIEDHLPLVKASHEGECLCLYVYEPEIARSEEFDVSHLNFINESLMELDAKLKTLGGQLTLRTGEVTRVLDELHHQHTIHGIWSHEETGNLLTFERDKRVAAWASNNGIPWREYPQTGVIRRLKSRDGWARERNAFLKNPPVASPGKIRFAEDVSKGSFCGPKELLLRESPKSDLQIGGESRAKEALHSFLQQRSQAYSGDISSPLTARSSCSRLSPYLAWGCISMKTAVHALRERQQEIREEGPPDSTSWLRSLRAFESRLSWHCHFMQKLEDEPAIEFNNMCRAYDGLREDEFRPELFDAWCQGMTGYPMVDACMRALHQHSWINFRMRAMLVSFASYHLWLHWRPTAVFLAKHFLDFEPGIHFSQFQMQSGTTGINTLRIYSPTKQAKDHDPSGQFIKKYVPELRDVPEEYVAEPHKMPISTQEKCGCIIGMQYPRPVVEHSVAYRRARERLYEVRSQDSTRDLAQKVAQKHGSRQNNRSRKKSRDRKTNSSQQFLF